jgi:LysM repeat protein
MQAARILRFLVLVPLGLALHAASAEAQTLRGSRASVDRIHRQAVEHRLRFYETPAAVRQGVAAGDLVRLAGNRDYQLAGVSHPYALPATALFVERLGRQYRSACGERLVVTSATRPRSVRLINSVDKSVHPTGMAIDLRRPANSRCLAWLRRTLLSLEAAGVLEAVEERNPPHFHVAVFPARYGQYAQRRGGGSAVAAESPRTASAPRATPQTTYRVRRGDSLWSIARRHGRTVEDIKRANGIRSNRIVVDQVLVIPQAR